MEFNYKFNYAESVLFSNGMDSAAFSSGQFFFACHVIIIQSW